VNELPESASDDYFASRARDSQIGAWASPQSEPLPDRAALDEHARDTEERFAGADIPRPPFWGGFLVTPDEIEFWQGQAARLHDRFRYRRTNEGWDLERLAP
jgi:pyridoxamine 5'-phosphate oxidase